MPIQAVIFLLSLTLVYLPTGELLVWSPAIALSFLFFIKWLKINFRDKWLVGALATVFFVAVFHANQEIKEFYRLIFVIGSFSLIYSLKLLNEERIFFPFFLFFLFELLSRLVIADFNEINLYTIKGSSGLYSDSNFSGLMLVYCIAGIVEQKEKIDYKKVLAIGVLLLLTFSRTAWIILATYLIAKMNKLAGYLMVIMAAGIPFWFLFYGDLAVDIDGSFSSKIIILNTFLHVFESNPVDLLWGLGRQTPGELTEELSGVAYQGHTIYGQVVQYGFFINLSFYLTAYLLVRRVTKDCFPFMISCVVGGFLGLSPASYFGMVVLVYSIFMRKDFFNNKFDSNGLFLNR